MSYYISEDYIVFNANLIFGKIFKEAYDYFQKYRKLPYVNVESHVNYIFK